MKRLIFIIPIAAIVLMCNSCMGLYIINKDYPVTIYGDTQDSIYINGKKMSFPSKLSSAELSDYKIKILAENYKTQTVKIDKRIHPLIFLDLINPLILGPFGFTVELISGMGHRPKKSSYAKMEPINRSDREKLEFWQELQLEDKALAHLEQWYNKALTDEERHETGIIIGRSLLNLNYLPDQAVLYFQKACDAVHMQPEEEFEHWAAIGNLLDERGDIKNAIAYFKKAYVVAEIPEKQQQLDLLEYGETYLNEGKTEQALLYFTEAQNIDASNSLVQQYILSTTNLQLSQRLEKQEQERVKRELEEQQRMIQEQRKQAWQDLAETLNTTANIIATINSNKKGTSTAYTPSRTSTGTSSDGGSTQTKQSSSGSNLSCADLAHTRNTDQRTYDNYTSSLMNMSYGLGSFSKGFNQSDRINYQSTMKQLRQKWESRGCDFYKSPWEDWNGVPKK